MARKKTNPANSLARFMMGIYDYYKDRGMANKIAKARMIDNTFEEAVKLMRKEEEVPDEMLVLMAQWMSRALNNRGAQITKKIEHDYPKGAPVPEDKLVPLWKIKQAKDAIDAFIETYTGWSDKEHDKNKE